MKKSECKTAFISNVLVIMKLLRLKAELYIKSKASTIGKHVQTMLPAVSCF